MSIAEEAIDLFVALRPEASQIAAAWILARTPPAFQPIMQRLVDATTHLPVMAASPEELRAAFWGDQEPPP